MSGRVRRPELKGYPVGGARNQRRTLIPILLNDSYVNRVTVEKGIPPKQGVGMGILTRAKCQPTS